MPEGLRLFTLSAAMDWAHLPVAGGLYDQDPELIDQFTELLILKAQREKDAQDKSEREQRRSQQQYNVRN